jgi:hypothetical protein
VGKHVVGHVGQQGPFGRHAREIRLARGGHLRCRSFGLFAINGRDETQSSSPVEQVLDR